ncbi:C39 family peptidase [Nocardia brasiliensis]|uniref:C39 family peptidase n=1 Tax=Nocardia brasiliensis TaxID=37326 RepID=UPI00245762AF|nr:C39 family peptidase [Nocardia brasiliensis]
MPEKILDHTYSAQETGYWCGPGSTQIALSARGIDIPEATLAAELGTDTDGTDWIGQITAVLTSRTGQPYVTVEIPDDPPTSEQVERLWADVRASIGGGNAIVANIVAVPGNRPPGYPAQTIYHYVTIVGHDGVGAVLVADPARFGGIEHYWLSVPMMASLIAPKGYAAAPTGDTEPAEWAEILTQLVGPIGGA